MANLYCNRESCANGTTRRSSAQNYDEVKPDTDDDGICI